MNWREIAEQKYRSLSPEDTLPVTSGIISINPVLHRMCRVTNDGRPAYHAFIAYKGKWWESIEPVTLPEFNALTPDW